MKKAGKILALSLLVVLMVSFMNGVVSAQDKGNTGGPEIKIGTNKLSEWWASIQGHFATPDKSGITIKILFWLLITLLFIMLSMFIVKKAKYLLLIIPISALVSYLLIAYITPEEAWGILQSYTVLGLALVTIIPLAILIGMTYVAATTGSGFLRSLQFIAWIGYLIYLIYRFVFRLIEGKLHITLAIALIIAIFAVIANGLIYRKIRKQIAERVGKESQLTMIEAAKAAKSLRKFREETGNTENNS